MKWIRWQGLIAFLVITAVLFAFWFLFIDFFIKRQIEKTGTALVGAKVELESADLTLFPLGLTLTRLQVTNPDEPMRNIFEAGRIAFNIDGANLIRKKYIIEEMAVEGVRLNTERKHSGAIRRPQKKGEPEEEAMKLLTLELPDPKEVLKKENIESVKLIEDLNGDIEADRAIFEKRLSELPDEKKIKAYEERIDTLKRSGGAIGKAGEVLALKNEIESEIKRVTDLSQETKGKVADYRKRVEEASSAPRRDVERIVKKYSLSAEGLQNLSALFIGGKVRQWIDSGLEWRGKVNNLTTPEAIADGVKVQKTPRGKGVDVQFKEFQPLPDFLIRKASVSVNIPSGDIAGLITNITGDQDILGSPMKIRLSGEKLKGLASALLEGEINRVIPESPKDLLNLAIKGYRLHDFNLTDNEYVEVALKEALADLDVRAELKGDEIAAKIGSAVKSALMEPKVKKAGNEIIETFASALSNVKAFNMNADVAGNINSYTLKLASDLDRVLGSAVGGALKAKTAAFENSIRADILGKTDSKIGELNKNFKGLSGAENIIDGRLKELKELLAKATKSAIRVPKLPF